MYKTKQIQYKLIIKHDTHKETVEYKCQGILKEDHKTLIQFKGDEGVITIHYSQECIDLIHNDSKLILKINERVKNLYQTPYGDMVLYTYLKQSSFDHDVLKITYELFDETHKVSTNYIMVQLSEVFIGGSENENL